MKRGVGVGGEGENVVKRGGEKGIPSNKGGGGGGNMMRWGLQFSVKEEFKKKFQQQTRLK